MVATVKSRLHTVPNGPEWSPRTRNGPQRSPAVPSGPQWSPAVPSEAVPEQAVREALRRSPAHARCLPLPHRFIVDPLRRFGSSAARASPQRLDVVLAARQQGRKKIDEDARARAERGIRARDRPIDAQDEWFTLPHNDKDLCFRKAHLANVTASTEEMAKARRAVEEMDDDE